MKASEFAEWMAMYRLHPWGLLDELIRSWGTEYVEPESDEEMVGPLVGLAKATGS